MPSPEGHTKWAAPMREQHWLPSERFFFLFLLILFIFMKWKRILHNFVKQFSSHILEMFMQCKKCSDDFKKMVVPFRTITSLKQVVHDFFENVYIM